MAQINITASEERKIKLMIFLEGTIFYTKPILHLFSRKGYISIGRSVQKLQLWHNQGAEIICCTYVRRWRINFILDVLKENHVPADILCYREKGQSYADVTEEICPDILIEDDCKSIGGVKQMCITYCSEKLKKNICSVVVKEFMGIDNLPDVLADFYK
jgi:hypothetical protein